MTTKELKKVFIPETDNDFLFDTKYLYLIGVIELFAFLLLQSEITILGYILISLLGILLCSIGYRLGIRHSHMKRKK